MRRAVTLSVKSSTSSGRVSAPRYIMIDYGAQIVSTGMTWRRSSNVYEWVPR